MDRLSVYVPKTLPRRERFLSGRRSCKGCVKALTARLVSKVADSADPALGGVAGQNDGLSANAFAHDRVNTADTIEKLVSVIDRYNEKSAAQSGTAHVPVKKPVIAIDRKILDTDFVALQQVLKHRNIVIVCFDNEAAIDRLIHKAIPRPFVQNERMHPFCEKDIRDAVRQKNIPTVAVKEDFAYLATACPSYPFDLITKVRSGLDCPGNAFVLVMTPCPTGWIFAPGQTLNMGRRAVLTGYFPLFEVKNGRTVLTVHPKNRKPVQEYLAMQKRFLPFPAGLMPAFQSAVDEFYEDIQRTGTIHEIATKA